MRCAERGGPALALGLHQRNPVDLVGMGTAPRRPPFAATGRTISPHRDYFERVPTLSAWGSSPGSAAPAATVAQPVPHPWNNSSHDVRQKKTKNRAPGTSRRSTSENVAPGVGQDPSAAVSKTRSSITAAAAFTSCGRRKFRPCPRRNCYAPISRGPSFCQVGVRKGVAKRRFFLGCFFFFCGTASF